MTRTTPDHELARIVGRQRRWAVSRGAEPDGSFPKACLRAYPQRVTGCGPRKGALWLIAANKRKASSRKLPEK